MKATALLLLAALAEVPDAEAAWAISEHALPILELVDGVVEARVDVVAVAPANPGWEPLARQLEQSLRALLRLHWRVARVEGLPDLDRTLEPDREIATKRVQQGAVRVVVARLYPGPAEGDVPRVVLSVHDDKLRCAYQAASIAIAVPRGSKANRGMVRVFSSVDVNLNSDAPAPRDLGDVLTDEDIRRRRFEFMAVELVRLPGGRTESGAAEYRIARGGNVLSDDELERMGLRGVSPRAVDLPTPTFRKRTKVALAALLGAPLLALVPAAAVSALGTTVFVGFNLVSALIQRWSAERAMSAMAVNGFYGFQLGVPVFTLGCVVALLVGAGGGLVFVGDRLEGVLAVHPYVRAVGEENRRLARVLGLKPSKLPREYFPDASAP
ncbi:MAG: hypothetical protein AB2A00_36500 [Myxococcota bacterium]